MANVDMRFGLKPLHKMLRVTPYYVPSTYGTALYIGDPVVKTGTANTAEVNFPGFKRAPGTLPEVNKATAGDGNPVTGAIVGFAPLPASPQYQYNPASTARVIYVADHPDQEFLIQADGTLAETSVGLNAVLIYTHAGSTVTGLSGVELDTTSDVPAADASNQLTILRIWEAEDNDVSSANSVAVVKINQSTEGNNFLGI